MGSRWVLPPVMWLARILRGTGLPRILAGRLPTRGPLGPLRLSLGMIAATAPPGPSVHGARSAKVRRRAQRGLGGNARTGILEGCVQAGLLGRVNRATERVLEVNGFKPVPVPGQGCCGALHAHTGDLEGARRLARRNILAFEEAGVEVIVVNAAGCGAAMKEYPHLLAEDSEYRARAVALASRVRDVSEVLGYAEIAVGALVELTVTYDAPCHLLHAQRISEQPIVLLASVPGVTLVPLAGSDECCGGAGLYGITHPDLGERIGRDKVEAVKATGARVVATPNPGCMMQIGAGLMATGSDVRVVHPVELVDESYRRGGYYGE
jgi:glycolate oxidase iron-sulfur subunit